MSDFILPELKLSDWRPSRDTIHQYARLIGDLREALMPPQKHWWHITLHTTADGLTTTPMPANGQTLELLLDFVRHSLILKTSRGHHESIALQGQSIAGVMGRLFEILASIDIHPDLESSAAVGSEAVYDTAAVTRYWQTLAWIDIVFKRFKGELREETSPVQVFPHHFDLAMSWFSGRLVPGIDPADEESADEQLTFGFLSGDETIPDAYFYITAYPLPESWLDTTLPGDAYWHTAGFTGAILMFDSLRMANEPQSMLLNYLRTVRNAASQLMR